MRCRYHHEHQQPGCFHSHPQFSKQRRVMALHCRSPIMTPVCLEIPLVLAHGAVPHGPATWLSFLLVPWHASLKINFLTLTPPLANAPCGLLSDSRLRIELTTPGACSSCKPGIWGVRRARFGVSIPNGSILSIPNSLNSTVAVGCGSQDSSRLAACIAALVHPSRSGEMGR